MSRYRIGSRWALAAAVAGCLALGGMTGAQAQQSNWYIGGSVPLMFIDDSETTNTTTFGQGGNAPTLDSTIKSEHDTGIKLGGSVGYHFDNGLRVEGEIFYARAKISKLTNTKLSLSGLPVSIPFPLPESVEIPVSGTAKQLGGMVNVWYDFDTGDALTPYIGGGIGLVRIDQGDVKFDTNAVKDAITEAGATWAGTDVARQGQLAVLGPLAAVDVPEPSATDTVFAYQIGAGVGYALTDVTTLQLGYRLQAVNGLEFTGMNAGASTRAETDLLIHFLEIGVRYRF